MTTTSDTLLSWMAVASARGKSKLRMNLCIARDILDGILDDYPGYVAAHLPDIMTMFKEMNQEMVKDIEKEFEEKVDSM